MTSVYLISKGQVVSGTVTQENKTGHRITSLTVVASDGSRHYKQQAELFASPEEAAEALDKLRKRPYWKAA